MFYACYATGLAFLTCEFLQRISDAFEEIEDVTVQCDWYLFPDKIKRMLPTILINAQQPVEMKLFGNFSCNRDAFKKVIDLIKQRVYMVIHKHSIVSFNFILSNNCRWSILDTHILRCCVNSAKLSLIAI